MYSYSINVKGQNYSIFRLENNLAILQDVIPARLTNTTFVPETGIFTETLTVNGYEYALVSDAEVISEVKNYFTSQLYKQMLSKIYGNVLIPSLMTKYTFAIYFYHQLCNVYNITETIDDLAANINAIAAEKNIEGDKDTFIEYYNFYTQIKNKIKDPLHNFDEVFFNDNSSIQDIIAAIKSLNDIYIYDPYTFLKQNLYGV